MNSFFNFAYFFQQEAPKNEGEMKKADGGAGKKDEGPAPVVLKVDLHCEGCAKKVKRAVRHFDGKEYKFSLLNHFCWSNFPQFPCVHVIHVWNCIIYSFCSQLEFGNWLGICRIILSGFILFSVYVIHELHEPKLVF